MTGMFDRRLAALVTALVFAVLGAGTAQAQVTAGAAKVDASWHVGASAGQYAGDCATDAAGEIQEAFENEGPEGAVGVAPEAVAEHACAFGIDAKDGTYDPTAHSTRRAKSYGLQSRLDVRALVIDGGEGAPVAIVKTNQYIPQDLLYRRAAQILEQRTLTQTATGETPDCPVTRETLTMAATHNHSSPMYSSTSWGVWAFQDVFDIRFYNYLAERIADAVVKACDAREPVRVGASVGSFDKTHRHSFGPAVADDGTPAGYPQSETDHDLTVVRFDTLDGEPLANLVNFSLHPEFLEGNDLLSSDYVAPLERITDRATGAMTVYTQGAVGTAEPENSTYHSIHERLEFSHRDYAQSEYAASLMSKKIVDVWRDVEAGTPEDSGRFVPFASDIPVEMSDRWYPGALLPSLSGRLQLPHGLAPRRRRRRPDRGPARLRAAARRPVHVLRRTRGARRAARGPGRRSRPDDGRLPGRRRPGSGELLGAVVHRARGGHRHPPAGDQARRDLPADLLVRAVVRPVEEHRDADRHGRRQRVEGLRLGRELHEARATAPTGPTTSPARAAPGPGTARTPATPRRCCPRSPTTSCDGCGRRSSTRRTAGTTPRTCSSAESEPTEVTEIKGNFTQDDDDTSAALGYTLTVPISMANDYNGYIASYREYQRGDHYRKALTGWGPHSSDYMASRLVTIGRQFKDPDVELPTDQQQEEPLAAKAEADQAINDVRAQALGNAGKAAIAAYEAGLPDDGGEAGAAEDGQPEDIERFDATFFTWIGGSNYTDDPHVQVLRRTAGGGWEQWADQSGELPVTVEFPQGPESAPGYAAGEQQWRWTAHFEAFVAPFDVGRPERATPPGTYKFVVAGERREGHAAVPYEIESETFEVAALGRDHGGATCGRSRTAG